MRKTLASNPWAAAAVSWVLATLLVSGGFALWLRSQGQVVHWTLLRDAALMAAPLALFRAWADSRRQK